MTTIQLERAFKALANRRRLNIIVHLMNKKEATVGELVAVVHASFPTVSKHLSILTAAGVVENERRQMEVYYRLATSLPPVPRSIQKFLK
ncbi:MAG TPA: metalloregulator ArsR/SmtB family transcription factor [Patescibacteria group bacterium]|nr:metalloregulator ArsR/SmtB family transcription factor [Patescibacteria group bacterium]